MIRDLDTKQGIMIDITNACINSCGNCMRYCGHYEKPFFMDFDFFKKVIDSLHDFSGQIGIIGGEPTLHPDFKKMVEYIRDTYPYKKQKNFFRNPVQNINKYILNNNVKSNGKFNLFTCASTQQFYDNFELIDEVFDTFRFNDHTQKTKHFTTLVDYKDFGITDEEFLAKEDDCWVQNCCFATVTPKGGFFCEMAGSLDMLYGGEGGFEIKDGWWKRKRDDFENQTDWCKHCGARLGLPMVVDNENYDYISESVEHNLKNSKRIKQGRYKVITKDEYEKHHNAWKIIKDKKLNIVDEICVNNDNKFLRPQKIDFVKTAQEVVGKEDWVVICSDESQYSEIEKYMKSHSFNIGCLYYKNDVVLVNTKSNALKDICNVEKNIWGYFDLDKIVKITNVEDNVLSFVESVIADDGTKSKEQTKKKSLITKILQKI